MRHISRYFGLSLCVYVCVYLCAPGSRALAANANQTITLKELRERLDYVRDNLIAFRFNTNKGSGMFKRGKRVSLFNAMEHFEGFPRISKQAAHARTMFMVGVGLSLGSIALMGVGTGLVMADIFSPTPTSQGLTPLFTAGMIMELGALAVLVSSIAFIAYGGGQFGRAVELHNQEVYRRAGLPPARHRQAQVTPPPPAPASGNTSLLMQVH